MVPAQLGVVEVACLSSGLLMAMFVLRDQNGARITCVCAQNHVVIEEGHHAGRARQHGIDARLVLHLVLCLLEGLLDLSVSDPEVLV